MRLFYSPTSPFVRKVLVVAHELEIRNRIELARAVVSPQTPNPGLAAFNPLMKVPTLVTDESVTLYGSQIICRYLDATYGQGKLVPAEPARWDVEVMEATADGILEAGIAIREDQFRWGEARHDPWVKGQQLKIQQGLNVLEPRVAEDPEHVHLGHIAAAVAVDWLVFRNVAGDINGQYPRLASWLASFAQRRSMAETAPREDSFTAKIKPA